jgi:hypothetical protein
MANDTENLSPRRVIHGARRKIHDSRRPRIRRRRKGDGKRRAARDSVSVFLPGKLLVEKKPAQGGLFVGLAGWRSERHQDHHQGVPDRHGDQGTYHGLGNICSAHAATSANV